MLIIDSRFLAAKLHMDSLSTKLSVKALKKAIENLPRELNDLYDDALRRIDAQNEDDREVAISLLRWVAYAYRPLTIPELEEALAIVPGEDDFDPEGLPLIHDALNACAGLLVVDDETEQVRMVHYTAQDYFDKLLESRFHGAHTTIAEHCITYLSYRVFQSYESETDSVEDDNSESDDSKDDDVENYENEIDEAENQVVHDDADEEDDSENDDSEDEDVENNENEIDEAKNQVINDDDDEEDDFEGGDSEDDDVENNENEKHNAKNQVLSVDAGGYNDSGDDEAEKQLIDDKASEAGNAGNKVVDYDSGADDASEEDESEDQASKDDEALPFHLLDYVSRHWASHATAVQGVNVNAQIYNFLANGARVWLEFSISAYDSPDDWRIHTNDIRMRPWHLRKCTGHAIAAYHGLDEVLRRLLKGSPNVNELTYTGVSALHLAAYRDHITAVNILLEYGASIECLAKCHATPLCIAVLGGSVNVSHLLVQRGAKVNAGDKYGYAPFAIVKWDAPMPFLQSLLDEGAGLNTINYYGETQLCLRARNGDQETVRWLLDQGALVNHIPWRVNNPLTYAIENGSQSLVQILLDHGAEVNPEVEFYHSPLYKACLLGQVELGRILEEHGALVNSNSSPHPESKPIHAASWKGDMEALITLSNCGGDTQAECDDGTALHIAASRGYRNCVDFLIGRGADVNAKGREGNTPLMSAVVGKAKSDIPDDSSFLGIIDSLLNAHANVDERNEYGLTALHMATVSEDVMVIHHLLEHHAATSIRSSLTFGVKYVWNWCFPCGHVSFPLSSGQATRVALYDPVLIRSIWLKKGSDLRMDSELSNIGNTASEFRIWKSGLTALDIAILGDLLECIRILEPLSGARTPSTTRPYGQWRENLINYRRFIVPRSKLKNWITPRRGARRSQLD